jgi:hypothetical protein
MDKDNDKKSKSSVNNDFIILLIFLLIIAVLGNYIKDINDARLEKKAGNTDATSIQNN